MATGNYTMTLNQQKKVFSVYAEGVFTLGLGKAYTDEFVEKSKSIDSQNWTLAIDVRKLSTVGADGGRFLALLKLYFSIPYKERYMTNIGNVICQMQVKKLGSVIPGFNTMHWVDNLDNI
jgi:hypothetical protein